MQIIDITNRDHALSIHADRITYYSIFDTCKPDPAWCYQDGAGHIHRWDLAQKTVHSLKRVVDEVITHCCDGDVWEEEITHLECAECGEHIEPGMKLDVPAGMPTEIPAPIEVSGSFDLLPGETTVLNERTVKILANGMLCEAYITGYTVRAPVFDPARETGITVSFEGGRLLSQAA